MKALVRGGKALVTGGAGFIGSHMTDRLLENGFEVVVVDNLSNGSIENISHIMNKIKFYKADVTDEKGLEEIFRKESKESKIDCIFHYAAIVGVERATKMPLHVLNSNIAGIKAILEVARRFDVERFMEASSSELYGDIECVPMPESIPPTPFSPYGVTKLVAEQYCRSYNEVHGLRSFIIRYFNVYGPRQDYKLKSWVMPNFILKCLSHEPPVVYGTGEQTRDFTYISDAIDGTLVAFEKSGKKTEGKETEITEIFNVGTGVETSIKDLANEIINLTDAGLKPIFKEKRKFDIKRRCADIAKIRGLGYEPKVSLEEGLKKTIEWFRSNVATKPAISA